ncbi:MAG: carbohydrate ABC transporter permease [Solirubrobacteraceae bacterium]
MSTTTVPAPALRAGRPQSSHTRARGLTGFGFLTPFLVFYVLFLLLPLVLAVIISLFNTSLVLPGLGRWVGLDNYGSLFADSYFWSAMWHTVLFTLVSTPVLVLVSLLFAVGVYRRRHGQWFYRLSFFMPYILPSAVISLIWIWIYEPGFGLSDSALQAVGIGSPQWLSSPSLALFSIVLVTVWWTIGFNFILFLAGLNEVPQELYEAASMDGASGFTQFRRITLPMLGRTMTLVTVLQIIASLKIFDQVYLITQGGPNFSSRVALEYIYDTGFTSNRIGFASAASLVLFVVIAIIGFAWLALVRRQERGV